MKVRGRKGGRHRFNSYAQYVPRTVGYVKYNNAFSVALGAGCAINLAFYGLIFVLSLFLQREQGRSAFETGLAYVPMTAVMLAVNPLAGRLQSSLGSRTTIAGGLALAAAGYLALLPVSASSAFVTMIPAFVMAGAGIAAATPATMAVALTSLPADRGGIGSGVINTARQVAGALGVALFGSLVSSQASVTAGLRHSLLAAVAVLVFAIAAVVGSLPTASSRRVP